MTSLCPVKQPRRHSEEKESDDDGNAANGTGEDSDSSFPDVAVEAKSECFFTPPPPHNDEVVADAEVTWIQENPPSPLPVPPLAQQQYLSSNRKEKTGDFQGQHVVRLRHNRVKNQHTYTYRRTLMQQQHHQQHQQRRQHDSRRNDLNDHGSPTKKHRRPRVIGGQKGPDTPHPIVVGDQKGPGPRLGCMWNLSPIVQRARKSFGLTCRSSDNLKESQGRNIPPQASPFRREATHYERGEDEDDDEEDEDYICDSNSDDYDMEVQASSASTYDDDADDDCAFNNVYANEIFEEVVDLVADSQSPGQIIIRAKRDRDSWNNSDDDEDEHEGGPEMGTNSTQRGIRKSLLDLEMCLSAALAWETLSVKEEPQGHHSIRYGREKGRKLPKSERTSQESKGSWKPGCHLKATVMDLLDDINSVIFEDSSAKKIKLRVFKALVVSAKLFRDNKEILVKVMEVLEATKDGMPLVSLVSVVLYLLRQGGTVIRLQELSMNILNIFAEQCANHFYDEHLHHRYDLFQVFCRLGGVEVLIQSLQTMQTACNHHLDKDDFVVLLYFHRMALDYVDTIEVKAEQHHHGDRNAIGPNGLVKEEGEEASEVDVTLIHSKLTIARVDEYFETHSEYMPYLSEERAKAC